MTYYYFGLQAFLKDLNDFIPGQHLIAAFEDNGAISDSFDLSSSLFQPVDPGLKICF